MTTMGVDPGIANTGIGVISTDPLSYIHHHSFTTESRWSEPKRLGLLYHYIELQLNTFRPDIVVVEDAGARLSHAMQTAMAIGIVELAADERGITCVKISPTSVKYVVTGSAKTVKKFDEDGKPVLKNGRQVTDTVAEKLRVREAILKYLPNAPLSTKDSAQHENDALAIALAYTEMKPQQKRKNKTAGYVCRLDLAGEVVKNG